MSRKHPGSRHHAALDRRRWATVRLQVLDRDNYRCQLCGSYGNETDHVVSLSRGGSPYDLSNLRCACRSCNIRLAAEDRRRKDPARDAWRKLVAELL